MASENHKSESPRRRRLPLALRGVQLGFRVLGAAFPRTAGRVAYWLIFRPVRARESEEGRRLVERADVDSSIVCNGKRVRAYVWGEQGPTVLLVHGWDSEAGRFHGFVDRLLGAGYRCVAFDAPGHGRSEGRETDILEFTGIISTLSEKYGPFSAVVAHSFGSMCLGYALTRSPLAERVVLISSPSRFDGLKEKMESLLAAPPRVIDDVMARVERRFADHSEDIWNRFSLQQNAASMRVPALIVHDRNDREVAASEAEEIHRVWPDSKLLLTEELGHHRIVQDPAVIADAVEFISG